ncbi:MAG: hypothetical protein LBB45_05575 [Methanobrevibacter sp.]|nr:hypothetical protein [Candidatus Methanovirga basalitermitum]
MSLQPFIVNDFDLVIIEEDRMYLDYQKSKIFSNCSLKIDIFLDMKTREK